ncbi:phytanoyl-CoA dioxygenase family protein [Kordiimonas aestuarii]|uniref:phytanoyl-CoA dioxygenase family protein n=1 Tax=Kordiimonas aestuarii TaxID=1005925 RepID=UPI00374D9898
MQDYETWTHKNGTPHVEPPIELLESMVTLKIYLDECSKESGPLRIALDSHRLGRISNTEAAATAASLPQLDCEADAGDVWGLSTPILHSSQRSEVSGPRRILHVDFAATELPAPLAWRPLMRS